MGWVKIHFDFRKERCHQQNISEGLVVLVCLYACLVVKVQLMHLQLEQTFKRGFVPQCDIYHGVTVPSLFGNVCRKL